MSQHFHLTKYPTWMFLPVCLAVLILEPCATLKRTYALTRSICLDSDIQLALPVNSFQLRSGRPDHKTTKRKNWISVCSPLWHTFHCIPEQQKRRWSATQVVSICWLLQRAWQRRPPARRSVSGSMWAPCYQKPTKCHAASADELMSCSGSSTERSDTEELFFKNTLGRSRGQRHKVTAAERLQGFVTTCHMTSYLCSFNVSFRPGISLIPSSTPLIHYDIMNNMWCYWNGLNN